MHLWQGVAWQMNCRNCKNALWLFFPTVCSDDRGCLRGSLCTKGVFGAQSWLWRGSLCTKGVFCAQSLGRKGGLCMKGVSGAQSGRLGLGPGLGPGPGAADAAGQRGQPGMRLQRQQKKGPQAVLKSILHFHKEKCISRY